MGRKRGRGDQINMGQCCACNKPGRSVRNLVMIKKRAPVPGSGWGCLVCDLPNDGALAVVCDACLDGNVAPVYAIEGYAEGKRRMLVADLDGVFDHDRAKHRAAGEENDDVLPSWIDAPDAIRADRGAGIRITDTRMVRDPAISPIVDVWLLWLPHTNATGSYFCLTIMHLRPTTLDADPKLFFPEATHEFQITTIAAGEPDPTDLRSFEMTGPANILFQFTIADDATACACADDLVRIIAEGRVIVEPAGIANAYVTNVMALGLALLEHGASSKVALMQEGSGS